MRPAPNPSADIRDGLCRGSLDDSEGIVDWPQGDDFAQLARDWLDDVRVRKGAVGRAQAECFDAQPFVDFAVRWMEANLL